MQDEIFNNKVSDGFEIPADVLDEIQQNIQNIIESFDIPDANKTDVIKKINFMYKQTKHISLTDALTGLYNRRHFESSFEREFSRAKRYNSRLSFAIIDIDFFKKVNDTYGHSCGDYILKEAAYLISNNFRITDLYFRYGGEEFAVILPETSKENAFIPMERLRKAFEEAIFKFNGEKISVTISVGVSELSEDISNPCELFDAADKLLYKAKENGRNQVRIN